MDSREEIIKKYITGKSVLDLGVGDTSDRFLHRFIKNNSKSAVGVELDKKRASRLRKKGFDIREGNAETINLKKRFDVIVAGDLIEHLNNPGIFLDNVKKHMKKNGLFICNTPNIYSINLLLRGFLLFGNVKQFPEHTLGFNEQLVTELFRRYKLKIVTTEYFSHKENTIGSYIIRFFSLFSKKWEENMIFILKK